MKRLLFFGLAATLFCFHLGFANAQTALPYLPATEIAVSGSSTVLLSPDTAIIVVEISISGLSASIAQKGLLDRAAELEQLSKEICGDQVGVVAIQEELSGVATEANVVKKGAQLEMSRTLALTINNLSFVGTMVDALNKRENLELVSVTYKVRDRENIKAEGIALATKRALAKANAAARMAGVKLGKLTSLVVSEESATDLATQEKIEGVANAGLAGRELDISVNVRYEVGSLP